MSLSVSNTPLTSNAKAVRPGQRRPFGPEPAIARCRRVTASGDRLGYHQCEATTRPRRVHREVARCGVIWGNGRQRRMARSACCQRSRPIPAGETGQNREHHTEHLGRAPIGTVFRDELPGRLPWPAGLSGALPGQEGPLVGKGEPVVGSTSVAVSFESSATRQPRRAYRDCGGYRLSLSLWLAMFARTSPAED